MVKSFGKKNSGFTLVEVVVVISIFTIMLGTIGISMSLARSRDVEQATRTIEQAIASARMGAMSQSPPFAITIDRAAHTVTIDGVPYQDRLPGQTTIEFPGLDPIIERLEITFDKSTGKVRQITGNGTVDLSNAAETAVLRIRVRNDDGSRRSTVVIIRNTGKYYIEFGE